MGECLLGIRKYGLPTGCIMLWSGAVNAIPIGWALCDGTAGTPDLRGRFVVGAGGAYAVNAKGGAETHRLTAGEMPSHTHQVNLNTTAAYPHSHTYQVREIISRSMAWTSPRSMVTMSYQLTGSASGWHSHTVAGSVAATGNGQAHENRPPYYALCYIMKIA